MQLKIGELSAITGIPPETLRYYERMGFIFPDKDENSAYRYYTPDDYLRLAGLKALRAYGFSTQEISEMIAIPTYEERHIKIGKKVQELEEKIKDLQLKLASAKQYQRIIASVPEMVGRCVIEKSPDCYTCLAFTNYFKINPYYRDNFAKRVANFNVPYFIGMEISKHALENYQMAEEFRWGVMLSHEEIRTCFLNDNDMKHFKHFASRESVTTTLVVNKNGPIQLSALRPAIQFIRENHFTIAGDAIGLLLYQYYGEINSRYIQVWIPVTK